MQEFMSSAMPLLAVLGPAVAIALGLTLYRYGRHKEKGTRQD